MQYGINKTKFVNCGYKTFEISKNSIKSGFSINGSGKLINFTTYFDIQ